ncbi:hypothetical protein LTR04_007167 [Oleoguttula sp. CCFEE 6159]|nr:hypothetical protein LTR04_007167 [Oleoguttula sp. CCFEE 6159]
MAPVMPTPTASDVSHLLPSPPVESAIHRSAHTTCPPEEDRQAASSDETADGSRDMEENGETISNNAHTTSPQQPTPAQNVEAGAADVEETTDSNIKHMDIDEDSMVRDTPSPMSSMEESRDGESRPSHAVAIASSPASTAFPYPQLYSPFSSLTDDHPTLTTYFEGEIIGPKHTFRTPHASWGSSEKTDMQHWARFPAWRPHAQAAKKSFNSSLKNFAAREHIFMRWKEYFLVPDHRVRTISGASFEGFYYICFDQRNGKVSGIYFHAKSEK